MTTTPNFKNRTLYHYDNLNVLRGINSETIDLIATDPPYNKGYDFHATPDSLAKGGKFQDRWSWEDDVEQVWVDQLYDDWRSVYEVIEAARHASGDDMGAFLCWLGVRLIEMHRVLKPTGSIYLQCDSTASHYIKAIMDSIFGRKQYRSEIIWKRHGAHSLGAKQFSAIHDIIFMYSNSNKWTWNVQYQPYSDDYIKKSFRYEDDKGRYQAYAITGARPGSDDAYKAWKGIKPSSGRAWALPRYSKFPTWINLPNENKWNNLSIHEKLDILNDLNMIHWPNKKGGKPSLKRYIYDAPGKIMENVWTDINSLTNDKERTGYPTQKPLALYERIIKASSNKGDVVLDPFAGCATTSVAAERLKRQWIGIDIWEGAHDIVLQRLEKEGLASPNPNENYLFSFGEVHYENKPPVRTDEGEVSTSYLKSKYKIKAPTESWEKLTHKEIRAHLLSAQCSLNNLGLIICAGCGRELEKEFMQLDHINPKAQGGSNDITNRVMLCQPCNLKKSSSYTLIGLQKENKKSGWLQNADMADYAMNKAFEKADNVKHDMMVNSLF